MSEVLNNIFSELSDLNFRSNAKKNLVEDFLAELRLVEKDVDDALWSASRLEFEYDGSCLEIHYFVSTSQVSITSSKACDSFPGEMSCQFSEIFERLMCFSDYLHYSPLKVGSEISLIHSFEAVIRSMAASLLGSAITVGPQKLMDITYTEQVRPLPILFFVGRHLGNYAHLLLDNLFAVFLSLMAHDFLDQPLIIVASDSPEPTYQWEVGSMFEQIAQTVFDSVSVAWVDIATMGELTGGLVLRYSSPTILDPVIKEVWDSVRHRFLEDDVIPDHIYASPRRSPLLRSYVARILQRLALERVAPDPLLFTVVLRRASRRILNHVEVRGILRLLGYRVEEADFAAMTFREQVLLMRRSAAVLTSYGANMANTIFLRPGTRVLVCWPNPDVRMFWPEKFCVMHTCALALGVVIVAVDKPYYDSLDRCGVVDQGIPFEHA